MNKRQEKKSTAWLRPRSRFYRRWNRKSPRIFLALTTNSWYGKFISSVCEPRDDGWSLFYDIRSSYPGA